MKWHPYLLGLISMAVANCAVTSLPSPDDKSSKLYRWFFNFAHSLVLAVARIASQYHEKNDGNPAVAP